MSLNGLDDVKVKEAHDAAIAEPGGWFLLKYISRDEVEILGRGNGGIVDIRNSIAAYEEASPLFGFLRYRRRNVLIKYVPEGCSRLVQARTTVHFNAVTEKFSPHDTIFPITTSKELKDSALSAACKLHTASGSTSSSTSSLRRRRLMEITEEADEVKRQSVVPEERFSGLQEPSAAGPQTPWLNPSSTQQSTDLPSSMTYGSLANDAEGWSSAIPPRSAQGRSRSPTQSVENRRASSQSQRPNLFSLNSYGSNGRQKVRLGPRPSLDYGGRPQTSASASSHRPISTLPAGLKLFSRSSRKEKDRPQSQDIQIQPSITMSLATPTSPPIPENEPLRPQTNGVRPITSSGASIKAGLSLFPSSAKPAVITPEKARLMKALQLRKRKQTTPSSQPTTVPGEQVGTSTTISKLDNPVADLAKESSDAPAKPDSMKEGDSGIALESTSSVDNGDSDATRTISTPASPVEPPEETVSTEASSISESTDETVRGTILAQGDLATKIKAATEDKSNKSQVSPVSTEEAETISVRQEIKSTVLSDHQFEQAVFQNPAKTVTRNHIDSTSSVVTTILTPVTGTESRIEEKFPVEDAKQVEIDQSSINPAVQSSLAPSLTIPKLSLRPVSPIQETADQIQILAAQFETASSPTKTALRDWKIPRSKFSVHDLKNTDKQASTAQPQKSNTEAEVFSSKNEGPLAAIPQSPFGSTFSDNTKRSLTNEDQDLEAGQERRKLRTVLVDPIRTGPDLTDRSVPASEIDFLSDDDLMDELQSATVQEAQHISVSKSPIRPVFPIFSKKPPPVPRVLSDSSKPENGHLLSTVTPIAQSSRSVSASAAFLNKVNQPTAAPMVKKVNLGSSISQRIKALERLSKPDADAAATAVPPPAPVTMSAFFSVRQSSISGSPTAPSVVERANSISRLTPSPSLSRDSSPGTLKIRNRSESIRNRSEVFNSTPTEAIKSQPESISVTARIVRDPKERFPAKSDIGKDPVEYAPLDLKKSPLVIDHQKKTVVPEPENETPIQEKRLSNPPSQEGVKNERRSSLTIVRDIWNDTRNSFAEKRKSLTIERPIIVPTIQSPSKPPSVHQNLSSPILGGAMSISSRRSSREYSASLSPSSNGIQASSATSDDHTPSKPNRATRMLRRMSSSLSSSRKALAHPTISPTVREDPEPIPALLLEHDIGDVNVQFPDTLLWKRRSMRVDSQGFLELSLAAGSKGIERGMGIKRFHLSEFRVPFAPELEAQELPNSVVLEFLSGSGLQVACEDRGGQARVLGILIDAHRMCAMPGR